MLKDLKEVLEMVKMDTHTLVAKNMGVNKMGLILLMTLLSPQKIKKQKKGTEVGTYKLSLKLKNSVTLLRI